MIDPKLYRKLEKLSKKIRQEELRMKVVFLELKENAEKLLKSKMIFDYDCFLKMELYSSKNKINKKFNSLEGDPYYVSVLIFTSMFEDDEFFNTNWSEGGFSFYVCYSMHD